MNPKRVAAALSNVDDNAEAARLKEGLDVGLVGQAVLADASQALVRTELGEDLGDPWTSALHALFDNGMPDADGSVFSASASDFTFDNGGGVHASSALRMSREMLDATQPVMQQSPCFDGFEDSLGDALQQIADTRCAIDCVVTELLVKSTLTVRSHWVQCLETVLADGARFA